METERNRTYSRYAEMREGLYNKFYEVEATEQPDGRATFQFRWGRIGTTGQTKPGLSYSFEAAVDLCKEQFKAKLAKGYREVTAMEAIAAAAQDISDRPVNGLPPVDVAIPCFFAGPSEERCRAFARKYLDKLNLIRKSKRDLGGRYYDQIGEIMRSFRAEWQRMRESTTHAPNLGTNAEEAFRQIAQALYHYGLMAQVDA